MAYNNYAKQPLPPYAKQQQSVARPTDFLKGKDEDFNEAMKGMDDLYSNMFSSENMPSLDLEPQANMASINSLFDDLMEPCEEEKKRRALANQKIAEKMAITGNKPEQNEYPQFYQKSAENQPQQHYPQAHPIVMGVPVYFAQPVAQQQQSYYQNLDDDSILIGSQSDLQQQQSGGNYNYPTAQQLHQPLITEIPLQTFTPQYKYPPYQQ